MSQLLVGSALLVLVLMLWPELAAAALINRAHLFLSGDIKASSETGRKAFALYRQATLLRPRLQSSAKYKLLELTVYGTLEDFFTEDHLAHTTIWACDLQNATIMKTDMKKHYSLING